MDDICICCGDSMRICLCEKCNCKYCDHKEYKCSCECICVDCDKCSNCVNKCGHELFSK